MPRQSKSKVDATKVVISAVSSPVVVEPVAAAKSVSVSAAEEAVVEKKKRVRKPKAENITLQTVTDSVNVAVKEVAATKDAIAKLDGSSSNETNAVVDASDTSIEVSLAEQSQELFANLQKITNMVSTIKTEYRALEKKWARELKAASKASSKRKKKSVNRAPSGFVKPTRISDELAVFLNKPSGTEMARTAVTREINSYIRANSLQDKTNGRKIVADVSLAQLLKLSKTDELTYFNLQRFMSPHFAKSVKATAAVVEQAV
jgi:chromatin remodeling complex protein RSC6